MASHVTFVTGTAEVKKRDHNGMEGMERPAVNMRDGKCDCCPYGYHIDLDFVNFCESITNGSTLKRLKRIQRAKRKLRKSMEVMLHQQDQARLQEAGTPPPDVVHSTEASRLMNMVEYEQSSTHRILDEIDSSVDQTIAHIDYMMRPTRKQQRYFSSDSEDGLSPVSPTRYNTFPLRRSPNGDESSHFATSLSTSGRTDSLSSLSSVSTVSSENPQGQIMTHGGHGSHIVHTTATAEISHPTHTTHNVQRYHTVTSAQLAETMATHFPQSDREGATSPQSTTTNISKMSLSAIREAMAMSLQRMKDLEEQVKALPILQVRISVLKEEKRLLMLQLKARNSKLNTRSVGVGDKSIHEFEVAESMSYTKILQPQSPVHSLRFPETQVSEPMSPRFSSPLKSPPPTMPKPKKSRTIGFGDHSVIEPYLLQPNLPTGYTIKENEVQSEIRTHVYERETFFRDIPRLEPKFDPNLKSPLQSPLQQSSPNTHITINQIQRGGPKALTRSIGVGEGNVFDNSGLHIHEKELRTVIIGQGGAVGKRNVGVECRVATRDVGVSYVCDDEKPSTRTVGVNVDTGSLLTSLSFKGEELRGALRDMLSKNVRSVGTNCNFKPLQCDVSTTCKISDTVSIGVGDCRTDVEVRAHQIKKSVGVGFHPEMTNRYVSTEKGWMLDQGTNTPVLDKKNKGTATEKPRYVYGSTNTDQIPHRTSSNQTDLKVFHATDQLKHASSNTQKIASQTVGINTESKCMQSEVFDFAITFQDKTANTMFSVADVGVNTDRGAYSARKGPVKSKTVGVSEDRVDSAMDFEQSDSSEQITRRSVETVSSVRGSQNTSINGGGSYMPADMSKFMSVEGSSSVNSRQGGESNRSSSTTVTDVKRRNLEGSPKSSHRKSGDDYEEYRYSEESYVIRGNDIEHGDFEIVQDLGGREKRLVTKKTDMPLDQVLGIDDKHHLKTESFVSRSGGTDLGLSRKTSDRHQTGGEGVGYIRYLTGDNAQTKTQSDILSGGTSSGQSSTMTTTEHVTRQRSGGSSSGSTDEGITTSIVSGGGLQKRGSQGEGGTVTTVEETIVHSGGSRGGGSGFGGSNSEGSTVKTVETVVHGSSGGGGSIGGGSSFGFGGSHSGGGGGSSVKTVETVVHSSSGGGGGIGSGSSFGFGGSHSGGEGGSNVKTVETVVHSSSGGGGGIGSGSSFGFGGSHSGGGGGSNVKTVETVVHSSSGGGGGIGSGSSFGFGGSHSGGGGGSNVKTVETVVHSSSGGGASSFGFGGSSNSGGSNVKTVEQTVVQSSSGGGDRIGGGTGLTLDVTPRSNRRGMWEKASGIDDIAGFSLSTSPTRLSGGSFTSDSGGSDNQMSESLDGKSKRSVSTRTVTTKRSTKDGETVTVEETRTSDGGKVTTTSTVIGNADEIDGGSRQSMLKSELDNLAGNLQTSQSEGFSMTTSQHEFNQGLGSDLDRNRVSSSHSSVNTSFDSENGTLRSIMKRSKSDTPVKKGISFASTVVGGTESEESTEGESENEGGGESDSSYEEGSYDGRQGHIVYQCKDDEAIAKGLPGAKMFDQNIRETFELSKEMRTACDVLANYLIDSTTIKTSQLNTNLTTIQKEWFQVSSQKLSDPYQVEDYMSSFNEISKKLLEYIVNMADSNGNTSLHYAVSNCNFDVVSLFLDSGVVDVNKQNKAGYTPIMLASLAYIQTHGQIESIRRLFRHGDVNLSSSQAGQTALMLAVSHGRTNMVEMLLECGADVNSRDNDGSTALMCACEHGHNDIVKLLLANPGTDANLTDNDGSTALSIAMEAGHKDIGVVLYAHLNFTKTSPGLIRKRKSSSSPTPSLVSR